MGSNEPIDKSFLKDLMDFIDYFTSLLDDFLSGKKHDNEFTAFAFLYMLKLRI